MVAHDTTALQETLEALAERFSGTVGVAARNLRTGEEVHLGSDVVLPTASVIKLPILVELHLRAEAGTVDLRRRLSLTREDLRGGSGVLKELEPGLDLTVRDAARLMIVLSDNTATNLVLDCLGGTDGVNRTMDSLGLDTIRLWNRIDFEVIGDDVRRLGESSPRHMCQLVTMLAEGRVGGHVDATVEEVLSAQQYLDQVPRYLEVTPYAADLGETSVITVACKTGFFTGTRVDAGIVRFPSTDERDGFTYAVFTHESDDETFLPEAEGAVFAGLVGQALTRAWWPGDGPAPVVTTPAEAAWAARPVRGRVA
jgi:beta-lactamase class A